MAFASFLHFHVKKSFECHSFLYYSPDILPHFLPFCIACCSNVHSGAHWSILVMLVRCRFLDTKVDGSNPGISMLCPWARQFIHITSVNSAVKWVPGGDNLVKGVQYYELFGGKNLKITHFCIWQFRTSFLNCNLRTKFGDVRRRSEMFGDVRRRSEMFGDVRRRSSYFQCSW